MIHFGVISTSKWLECRACGRHMQWRKMILERVVRTWWLMSKLTSPWTMDSILGKRTSLTFVKRLCFLSHSISQHSCVLPFFSSMYSTSFSSQIKCPVPPLAPPEFLVQSWRHWSNLIKLLFTVPRVQNS